jgi:hypothetical protein
MLLFLSHFSASTAWNINAAATRQRDNSLKESGCVLKILFAAGK